MMNSTAVRFLVLCILYTSPIVLINLYLLKNQDSITSLQIVYISLLFVPVFLIEKSWIPISNLFKFNDVDTSPVPGKIGRFSEILNSTIASEKDRVKVEFKSNVVKELLNCVRQTYDERLALMQKTIK